MLQFIQDICWKMWSQCTLLFCMLDHDTSVLQCLIRCPHIKMVKGNHFRTLPVQLQAPALTPTLSVQQKLCVDVEEAIIVKTESDITAPQISGMRHVVLVKKENNCQPNCNCINCDNPYGQNQKVSQQSSDSQRKRHRHEEQDQRR